MKKSIYALIIIVALGGGISLLVGCSSLGNGKVEFPDISIDFVSEDGRTFAVHKTDQGIDIEGEYFEPRSGLVFVLGEGLGSVSVRDPRSGLQFSISPQQQQILPPGGD